MSRRISALSLSALCALPAALAVLSTLALLPSEARAQSAVQTTGRLGAPRLIDYQLYFRGRGELFHNLDLDRGPTPSGAPLFPVPQADPEGQELFFADLRLRGDIAFYVPETSVSIHLRLDVLDNLGAGSMPSGPPADARAQLSPGGVFRVKRAWAQVLTPFGVFAAGRIGSHWGLGMLSNGGDCESCDTDDNADRLFFATSLVGHIWSLSFDISSSGPFVPRADEVRFLDLDPSDDVRTFTFAMLNIRSDHARRRRVRAGQTVVEYGLFGSYRWQARDWPSSYLPTPADYRLNQNQILSRGYEAGAFDAFLTLNGPWGRIGAEAALVLARFEEASVIPGVLLRDDITSTQWGFALESSFNLVAHELALGLDLGAASGDSAPGFGAFPTLSSGPARAGDLNGAQVGPPGDTSVDNFRFHPNYRIDRILFREIIGTVTDAFYLRPHGEWSFFRHRGGRLQLSVAGVFSVALEANSAPGGDSLLGVELDPSLRYENDEGWAITLDYAALFPLAGLSNPVLGLDAQPAQLLRLRVMVRI